MARKTEIVCDRCGRDIINPSGCYCPTYALKNYSAKITYCNIGEARSGFGQRIDLCEDCNADFLRFMEGGNDA